VERPTCIFTVRSIAIYSVDQGHSTNFGAFGPTLSRWRHGFESRWGCASILVNSHFLVIASVRNLWKNPQNHPLCVHRVPVVCPNQLAETSQEIELKQNQAFDYDVTSAFPGGVLIFSTDHSTPRRLISQAVRVERAVLDSAAPGAASSKP
jgi:hypothetical protein